MKRYLKMKTKKTGKHYFCFSYYILLFIYIFLNNTNLWTFFFYYKTNYFCFNLPYSSLVWCIFAMFLSLNEKKLNYLKTVFVTKKNYKFSTYTAFFGSFWWWTPISWSLWTFFRSRNNFSLDQHCKNGEYK